MAQVILAPGEFNGEPLQGFGIDPQIILFQPGVAVAVPLSSDAHLIQTLALGVAVQNDIWLIDQAFCQFIASDASGQIQILSVEAVLSTSDPVTPPGFVEGVLQNSPISTLLAKVASSRLVWSWLFPPTKSEQIANTGSPVTVRIDAWVRNNDGAAAHSVTLNMGAAFRHAQKVVS